MSHVGDELPIGWVTTDLGSVTKPRGLKIKPSSMGDAPFVGLESIEAHTMRLLAVGRTGDVKSAGSYFSRGDVLYGRLRPYLNKVYMTSFTGLASGEFIVFPSQNFLDNAYLKYFLNQVEFASFATRLNAGDRPRVNFDQFANYPLPLPPLPEQRRIVAEIEKHFTRLDASVAALKRVQANLRRYRASVLKSACEGKLVPTEAELARSEGRYYEPADRLLDRILFERRTQWESQEKRRGKYKEPTPPDTSNLSELPEGWVWAGLDQLATNIRNGYSKRPRGDIGTPILRISAVRPLSVNLQDIRWVDSKDDLAGFLIHPGDLLFTRYNGNPSLVGVCGVVPALDRDTLHPDKLIRACLTKNGALPNYVQSVANSGVSRKFLERRIRTTAGQSGISGSDLKSMPIPLPPIAEQRRIVAEVERRLSVIQKAEAAVEASLVRANRLRQSVLKQAFSGKLVPQDPNDEPASVLLERIRAEREAARDGIEERTRRPAKIE